MQTEILKQFDIRFATLVTVFKNDIILLNFDYWDQWSGFSMLDSSGIYLLDSIYIYI